MGERPRPVAAVAFVAALLVGCSTGAPIGDTAPEVTPPAESGPAGPGPLRVTLDPNGEPYDEALPDGYELVREHLVDLELPSGRVMITAGEDLPWLGPTNDTLVHLELGGPGRYPVEVVWLRPAGESGDDSPAGLVLHASDAPVESWGTLEFAYGTDGGMGALSTPEYHASNVGRPFEQLEAGPGRALLDRLIEGGATLLVDDLDPVRGPDTILFQNGFGDGGFPLARGVDADGELAAVVIWHVIAPWRLGIPEGTPPPDITAREEQLRECLDGDREVTDWGWCVSD